LPCSDFASLSATGKQLLGLEAHPNQNTLPAPSKDANAKTKAAEMSSPGIQQYAETVERSSKRPKKRTEALEGSSKGPLERAEALEGFSKGRTKQAKHKKTYK